MARSRRRLALLATSAVLAAICVALPASASAGLPLPPSSVAAHPVLIGYHGGDDWEPSVAADRDGNVYVAWAHFGGVPGCHVCGSPAAMIEVSPNGGHGFGAPRPINPSAKQQVDLNVEVNGTGAVFVSYLNGRNTVVQVSADEGRQWAPPVAVNAGLNGSTDKPGLVVTGSTAYVAYDIGGQGIVARSTDGGRHFVNHFLGFAPAVTAWSLNGGGAVAPDGTVYFAWAGVHHSSGNLSPQITYLSRSTDGGRRWTFEPIAKGLRSGPACPQTCGWDFLGPQATVAVDGRGHVYVLYNGAYIDGAAPAIWFSRSTDRGASWSVPVVLSTDATPSWHVFPAIDARENGQVYAAWMDNSSGAYNVWYRSSLDGGHHWTTEVRVSSFHAGLGYANRSGFAFPYGDYFILRATGHDVVHVAWGEGPDWTGPGNVLYARIPVVD